MFKRMLVPIDGTHASATVIPYAATVAQRLGCRVDLLLVEPTSGARPPHPEHHRQPRVDPGEAGSFAVAATTPEHIRQANERYVARHVEEFEAIGVDASGRVVCGETVEQILDAALELRSDVIAMTTRKMSNYARQDTGSISGEVLWRSKLPVLLVAHG